MSKYRCYDWNGNLIVSEINDLKEAVRQSKTGIKKWM